MADGDAIYREKVDQATALLRDHNLDAWLVFVRETSMGGDPAMELVAPFELTWESALLFGARGERIAIVGRYDVEPVKASGIFSEVSDYDAGIGPALRDALRQLDPASIAINYS